MTAPTQTADWPIIWMLVFALVVLLEGIALGEPQHGDTLSEMVAVVRWDAVGRFLVIPLWTWLTWHFVLRPKRIPLFTWRDVVFLVAGVALAAFDAWRATA